MGDEERDPLLERVLEKLIEPGRGLSPDEARELIDAYSRQRARVARLTRVSDLFNGRVMNLVTELKGAVAGAKVLKGLIPICASCKKIRSSNGRWQQLEQYIVENSDALFSHSFCPHCASKYVALHQEASPTPAPAQAPTDPPLEIEEADLEDPTVVRFLPVVNDPNFASSALHEDLKLLLQRYVRLVRRLARIARISDAYQAELHEAKAALERSSRTDPLTGIPNRLDLLDRFATELMRARRHERPLAVIMLDLDDFKQINDAHGHLAGDQVLVAVAQLLRANLRAEDLYARWGGEEFLVVLPESDLAKGSLAAEKLRHLVEDLVVPVGGATVRVTASFGVAPCRGSDEPDGAIRRADVALYEAKSGGRNRCVSVGGEVERPATVS